MLYMLKIPTGNPCQRICLMVCSLSGLFYVLSNIIHIIFTWCIEIPSRHFGVDECSIDGGRNTLLDFLYTQIHKFPSNVKFILTSRNIEYIHRKFPKMSRRYLNASSENNMNDIRQYIKKTTQTTEGNLCICVYRKSRSVFLPPSILHSSRASIMIMNCCWDHLFRKGLRIASSKHAIGQTPLYVTWPVQL
jgi:hypothetical protein